MDSLPLPLSFSFRPTVQTMAEGEIRLCDFIRLLSKNIAAPPIIEDDRPRYLSSNIRQTAGTAVEALPPVVGGIRGDEHSRES